VAPGLARELPFDPSLAYIGGHWQAGHSAQTLPLFNPSNSSELGLIARCDATDIEAAVQAARRTLLSDEPGAWAQASAAERGRCLQRIGALVYERIDELARLEALDAGKPLTQARADALALARSLEYYAGAADKIDGQTIASAQGCTAFTLREPIGVIAHLLPSSDSLVLLGRSVGAALALGNACIVKPSEQACLSALAFAHIAHEAGLPAGAFNVVPGLGSEAGTALVAHPGVQHVSFAGSPTVGRLVQISAAKHSTPVSLVLDGKSMQLVFADADLDLAVPALISSGIHNAGQCGWTASRVLVQQSIYADLLERMAQRYRALRVGPALADLDLGPVISERRRDQIEGYLAFARQSGLNIIAQGRIERGRGPTDGHFVCPSLLSPVHPDHRLMHEEVHGPVQMLVPFKDEAEALAIANGTSGALLASVWTRDGGRQLRLARALQCAQVFVNDGGRGTGIELPSGHSRGQGLEALYTYSTLKTVAISHG
jgi:aldehyde dehydrogenase (NAD+)